MALQDTMDSNTLLYVLIGVAIFYFVVFPRLGKISSEKARELVGGGAILVDVRTKAEWNNGHINGARHVPLDTIGSAAEALKAEGKAVVVYCASGMRSGAAKRMLKAAGISEVYDVGAMSRY